MQLATLPLTHYISQINIVQPSCTRTYDYACVCADPNTSARPGALTRVC